MMTCQFWRTIMVYGNIPEKSFTLPLHVKTVQSKKGGVTNTKEIIILK